MTKKRKNVDRKSERRKRPQMGALCYRRTEDGVQILLITSRETRRWIGPKGWPIKKLKPWQVAEVEAREEAGVSGQIGEKTVGRFSYVKNLGSGKRVPCAVQVYPLKVEQMEDDYPEARERTRKWLSPRKAAKLADPPAFGRIIRRFADDLEKEKKKA